MEVSFFQQMATGAGAARLHALIIDLLPKTANDTTKSLETTLVGVQSITGGALFKFCAKSVQAEVRSVLDNISKMMQGYQPTEPNWEFQDRASLQLLVVAPQLLHSRGGRPGHCHKGLWPGGLFMI